MSGYTHSRLPAWQEYSQTSCLLRRSIGQFTVTFPVRPLGLPDVALEWCIHENQVLPNGKLYQLCVAMQIQGFHDAVFVKSHRSRRKIQGVSYFLHGETFCKQLQYIALSGSERGCLSHLRIQGRACCFGHSPM